MSLNVGSLWANLSLNIGQFTAALAQAQAQVRTAGNQMSNALGRGPSGAINNTTGQLNQLNNQINRTGKDFQRVVGGILMAQAFYRLTNAIEETAKAVVTFSNNMQMATISMEYFLGSKEKAEAFVDVMKDFAATTPFTTEQALNMTRRLMAMGYAAESVKSVMGILVDAASATGGTSEQMDRVVLALGQMKTNGYIAGQELRQLAEAGIPAYKILQEELGLTADQLKKIGKLKISGDLGVDAILKGLEKRYKGAAKRIAETIPGMWSTIKDDFLIISEQMIKGSYNAFDGFLRGIRDKFEEMRQALRSGGLGGMFEAMFPPELHGAIRNIIASFRIITSSVGNVAKALAPVVSMVGGIFISTLGKVLPIVAAVIKVLSNLVVTLITAVPGIKLFVGAIVSIMIAQTVAKTLMFFWTVVRAGAICNFVAQSVMVLTRAIQFLYVACTRNPIVGIIMLIAGALLALALSSKTVTQWLDQVTGKLAALAGVDPGGILNPENNKELSKWTDEFNKSLADMNKNLKGVGKEAEKAGKKTKDKFLASFDEVFQVPEKLDDAEDALAGISDMNIPAMPDLKMPNLNDALPDLGGLDKNPFDNMPPLIPENKNPKEPKGGGGNIPPPDPSPVEAFVATIESLVAKARKALENLWPNPFPVPVITIKPLEAFESLLERVKAAAAAVKKVFEDFVIKPIVVPGIEAAKTALEGLKNVGLTIIEFFTTTMPQALGTFFTEMVPNMLSAMIEGFKQLGASIGPVIWSFLQGVGTAIVDGFKAVGSWIADHWKEILIGVLVAVIAVVLFIFGGEIVAAIGALGAGIWAALSAIGSAIAGFFSGGLVASCAGAISAGFAAILGAIVAALAVIGPVVVKYWDEIVAFFAGVWDAIVSGVTTAWNGIVTFFQGVWSGIQSLATTVWTGIQNLFTTVWSAIQTAVQVAISFISALIQTQWNLLQTVTSTVWNGIKTLMSTIWSGIQLAISTAINVIKTVITTAWNVIQTLTNTVFTAMKTIITGVMTVVQTIINTTIGVIKNVISAAWNLLQGNTTAAWNNIKTAITTVMNGARSIVTTVTNTIKSVITTAWNGIKTVTTTVWNAVKETISGVADGITGVFSGLKDSVLDIWDGIWGGIKRVINFCIDGINTLISSMNKLSFDVPDWVPGAGGKSFGFKLDKIPHLAKGGIINKDQLIRAGEGNKSEVMIPLENSTAMRPFSAAVASDLMELLTGTQGATVSMNRTEASTDTRPVYFITADERSLRDLERRLKVIRLNEGVR